MRQIRRLVTAILAFLLALGCCGWAAAEAAEPSVWVVVEYTGPGQMDTILDDAIAAFREKHPDVRVNLEILSPLQEIRQSQLTALREAMEARKGPDVYVLRRYTRCPWGPRAALWSRCSTVSPMPCGRVSSGTFPTCIAGIHPWMHWGCKPP